MYPTAVTDLPDQRDRFRSGATTLAPGPLRDVLIAVAYARDEAARTGAALPPSHMRPSHRPENRRPPFNRRFRQTESFRYLVEGARHSP